MLLGVLGSAAVAPPSANLALWLRADLGVTLVTGRATVWADQSGNGNNFTAGAGPTPNSSSINGKPALTFDGIGTRMTSSMTIAGAKTVAMVFKLSATPGGAAFYAGLSLKTATPSFSDLILSNLGAPYLSYTFCDDFVSATTSVGVNTALDTSGHCLVIGYNGGTNSTPGNYSATLDGVTKTVAASSTLARTPTDLCSLGARVTSGGTPSSVLAGDVCEVLAYSVNIDAPTSAKLQAYFLARYGL